MRLTQLRVGLGVHWYVYKICVASLKTRTNVGAVWETEARPSERERRACQVGECGEKQGAGMQVTCSEAIDRAMRLEERTVNHMGQASVGPMAEGLERQGKRSALIP